MTIQQLSIFLENKMGHLADVTDLLGSAGIDIRALSLADTEQFGILRLIVNQPEQAVKVLRDADMTVLLTDVVAATVEDKPGAFGQIVRLLAENNINIEYLYAFVSRQENKAITVLRTDDTDRCVEVLRKGEVPLLTPSEIYGI